MVWLDIIAGMGQRPSGSGASTRTREAIGAATPSRFEQFGMMPEWELPTNPDLIPTTYEPSPYTSPADTLDMLPMAPRPQYMNFIEEVSALAPEYQGLPFDLGTFEITEGFQTAAQNRAGQQYAEQMRAWQQTRQADYLDVAEEYGLPFNIDILDPADTLPYLEYRRELIHATRPPGIRRAEETYEPGTRITRPRPDVLPQHAGRPGASAVYVADENGVLQRQELSSIMDQLKTGLERVGTTYDWTQRNITGPAVFGIKDFLQDPAGAYEGFREQVAPSLQAGTGGASIEETAQQAKIPSEIVGYYQEKRAENQAFIEDETKPWAARAFYDAATNPFSYVPFNAGAGWAAKLPASMKALRIPVRIVGELVEEGGPLFAFGARIGGEGAVRYQEDIPVLKHMDPVVAGLLGALIGGISPRIASGATVKTYKWSIDPEVQRQLGNGIENFATSTEAWTTAVANSPFKAMAWMTSPEGQAAITAAGVKFDDVVSAIFPTAIQAAKDSPAYVRATWVLADEIVKYNLAMALVGRPLKQGESLWEVLGDSRTGTAQGVQEYIGNAYLTAGIAVEMAARSPGVMWDAVKTAVDEKLMTPQRGAQIVADAVGESADDMPFLRSVIPDEAGDGAIRAARQPNTADAFADLPVDSNGQPSPYISTIRDALSAGEDGAILNPAWTAWQGMKVGAENLNGVVINPAIAVGNHLKQVFNGQPRANWMDSIERYQGLKNRYMLELRHDGHSRGNAALKEFGMGEPVGNTRLLTREDSLAFMVKIHARADGFDPNDARFALTPEQEVIYDMARGLARWEEEATFAGIPGFKTHIVRGSEPFTGVYFPREWTKVYMNPEETTRWAADAGLGGNQRAIGGGTTSSPGFTKPRGDETFQEMVTNVFRVEDVDDPRLGMYYRLEPLSWNPFDMMVFRAAEGINYREQMALLRELQQMKMPDGTSLVREWKETIIDLRSGNERTVPSTRVEEGWRIPQVDAFRAQGVTAMKYGWEGWQQLPKAVPNEVATMLENVWPPAKTTGAWDRFQEVSTHTKQLKLMGSFFQNADFGTRTAVSMWAGAIDDALHLQPREAARKTVQAFPKAAEVFSKGYLPEWSGVGRQKMWDNLLSDEAIFTPDDLVNRYGWDPVRAAEVAPQLTGFKLIEHGLSTSDASLVDRSIQRDLQRLTADVLANPGTMDSIRMSRGIKNALQLQKYMEGALFDGTYPALAVTAAREVVLPRLLRQYKNGDVEQILFQAADLVNVASSTLRNTQSILAKSPGLRSFMHAMIFSTNETESLMRQFFGMMSGSNKRFWGLYNIGAYTSLMVSANIINWFATAADAGFDFSEGELLPAADWLPIQSDEHAPLGISYNSGFAAPQMPFVGGRSDTPIDLDLVGQLDTAFRTLDGADFIRSRVNVIPRAVMNQLGGEDFWGRDVGDAPDLTAWAPGQSDFGSRLYQALVDVGAPIFYANVMESARQALGIEDAYPEGEGRIGILGNLVQSLGFNVRGEATRDYLTRMSAQFQRDPDDEDQTPYNYYAIHGEPGFMSRAVRTEFMDSPQVAAEMQTRKETGAARGNEWSIYQLTTDEQRDAWHEGQVADDKSLIDGEITEKEWRARRTRRIQEAGITTDVTRQLLLELDQDRDIAFEDMDPVGQWVAIKEENTTFDGQINWDALDAWLYSHDVDFRDYVFENMGLRSTPKEQEYRKDMRSISENRTEGGLSYWDMRDLAFKQFLTSNGISSYGTSDLELIGPGADIKRLDEGEHARAKEQEFFGQASTALMKQYGPNWETVELENGGTLRMVADAYSNWATQTYFAPMNRMLGDLHTAWINQSQMKFLDAEGTIPNPTYDGGLTSLILQRWEIGALSESKVLDTIANALNTVILENPELEAILVEAGFTR